MYRESVFISSDAETFDAAKAIGSVTRHSIPARIEDSTCLFYLVTLGSFRFYHGVTEIAAPRTANARALLTYCIAHAGQDIARERMLELFWSNSDISQARGSFKTALWLIRASLRAASAQCDDSLFANKTIVRWDGPTWLDRDLFMQAAARSDMQSLRTALTLYTGDFLEGDYGQWAVAERTRTVDVYENLLLKILALTPEPEVAERLLERNPYSETAYRILIADRLATGCFRSAARYAQRCITALAEVGEEPSADFLQRYIARS